MIVDPPIIVLGTARSGSSLTAGLLHYHGVWVGDCRPADKRNPKGYFENQELKFVRTKGPVYFKEIQHILRNQGYKGGPWLVKHGPQHWWNWLPLHPRFVLCRRNKKFSVDSWMKHETKSLEVMERYQRTKVKRDNEELDRVRDEYNGIEFHPGSLSKGFTELFELFEKLGIEPNEDVCREFYEPSLWSGG